MKKVLYFLLASISLSSCSINKQISKEAQQTIFSDSNFAPAHTGISIYDPSSNKYLYNYQGDKYFVPASNMKLFTCYAAMKNLGDSLVGLRYFFDKPDAKSHYPADEYPIRLLPTGDPSFLHPDFAYQPVKTFIETAKRRNFFIHTNTWKTSTYGDGWAWNDLTETYAVERSAFPIHGNTVDFIWQDSINLSNAFGGSIPAKNRWKVAPPFGNSIVSHGIYLSNTNDYGNNPHEMNVTDRIPINNQFYTLKKSKKDFVIWMVPSAKKTNKVPIPIPTSNESLSGILTDIFGIDRRFTTVEQKLGQWSYEEAKRQFQIQENYKDSSLKVIKSQPTDSLLKPMMHRSDNFFAEQTLLMVSNEKLGFMSDRTIIDTLLNTDFKNLPQKPKWVDGSGLSRYNLITPQDFVWVLNQMKNDFKWERVSTILPTGNEGTLAGLYKNYAGKIYAKTGTLSNNVALSGYITTNKGKQLIFSILVNNHQTSASNIRKTMEKFLTEIIEKN